MAQKPSIPKGTRDFSPLEMARRNYIFDTIKSVFSLYGFQQIETPAMENLSTVMVRMAKRATNCYSKSSTQAIGNRLSVMKHWILLLSAR